MMEHIDQLEKTLKIESKRPIFKCKVIEDNNDAIKLPKAPKIRTRIKHIFLKYHHFRENVSERSDWNKSNWNSWISSGNIYKSFTVSNIYLCKEIYDGLEQKVIDLEKLGSVRIRRFVKL